MSGEFFTTHFFLNLATKKPSYKSLGQIHRVPVIETGKSNASENIEVSIGTISIFFISKNFFTF